MLTTCLFVSILACGQTHDPDKMPALERGILIKAERGKTGEVQVESRADVGDESCVVVYNHSTGEKLRVWNSHFSREGSWTLPANDAIEPVFYLIVHYSKDGGPDGSKPWYFGARPKILDETTDLVVLGTADFHNNQQYNSGKIKLTTSAKK